MSEYRRISPEDWVATLRAAGLSTGLIELLKEPPDALSDWFSVGELAEEDGAVTIAHPLDHHNQAYVDAGRVYVAYDGDPDRASEDDVWELLFGHLLDATAEGYEDEKDEEMTAAVAALRLVAPKSWLDRPRGARGARPMSERERVRQEVLGPNPTPRRIEVVDHGGILVTSPKNPKEAHVLRGLLLGSPATDLLVFDDRGEANRPADGVFGVMGFAAAVTGEGTEGGFVIRGLPKKSALFLAGLREGDTIWRVDNRSVQSGEDVRLAARAGLIENEVATFHCLTKPILNERVRYTLALKVVARPGRSVIDLGAFGEATPTIAPPAAEPTVTRAEGPGPRDTTPRRGAMLMTTQSVGRILTHDQPTPAPVGPAAADDRRIRSKAERSGLRPAGSVLDLVQGRFRLDVHRYEGATDGRAFALLLTSGMSALPMTVPSSVVAPHAELCLMLPSDWPVLSQESLRDPHASWPLAALCTIARLPHVYGTWLSMGHSIPNGEPPTCYVDRRPFCAAVLVAPLLDIGPIMGSVPGEPSIHVYQVLFLTQPELQYKLDHGWQALLDRMEGAFDHPHDMFSLSRGSVV
jgi:hypothetical protein